jgi:CubicO group peptidase (beta-lactamase class C family)
VERLVAEGTACGAVVAVSKHGALLAARAFGTSGPAAGPAVNHGLTPGMPLAVDSIFAVASVTKPAAAAAVLLLAQSGALSLEDRLVDHLPEFAAVGPAGAPDPSGRKQRVTLRQLLMHWCAGSARRRARGFQLKRLAAFPSRP